MKKKPSYIVNLVSFIMLMMGVEALAADHVQDNRRKRYDYFLQEAARHQAVGRYGDAFSLLQHAQCICPDAPETYYYLSLYYDEMKQDSLAKSSLDRALVLAPDNLTYREHKARKYLSAAEYDKAIEAYETIYAKNHDNTDALYILLQLYQQQKEYPKMLNTLNRLETEEGESEKFTLEKMHIYELMNDNKSAYRELKNLADTHPLDMQYKTMLGNWLMAHQREKEAYKLYQEVMREEPDNSAAQMSLYDYYNVVGDSCKAHEMLDRILLSPKTDNETVVTMLRSFIQDNETHGGDSSQVIALFDRMLAQPHRQADVAELKAAYMQIKKMPVDSINVAFQKVLDIAPERASARMQLIQNLWQQENYDAVIQQSEAAHAYNPEEMVFYYFGGMAHYMKKDEDRALAEFRNGVAQINANSDKSLVSDLYMIMGDILHKKNRAQESFAAYDSCLQWKPDNIMALNNYAYYLSLQGKDLQRAELMSYKTIKAEPKSATYLDTYAWILFRQERYADAKTYIDQTIACLDSALNNASVLEHAGDIYAMNGLVDKAVEFWQQALDAYKAKIADADKDNLTDSDRATDEKAMEGVRAKLENRKYMTETEISKIIKNKNRKWKETK